VLQRINFYKEMKYEDTKRNNFNCKKIFFRNRKNFPDFRKKRGIRYSFQLIIRMIIASIVNGIIELNKMKDFISSPSMVKYLEDLDYKGKCPKIGCLRIVISHIPKDLLLKLNNEIKVIKEQVNEEKAIENNIIKKSVKENKGCFIKKNKSSNILLNLENKLNEISKIKDKEINFFNKRVIAFDGKAMRSGHLHCEKALMYLNGIFCDTGIPFIQELVDKKTNEIPVFRKGTKLLDLSGYLCTLDALHTQKETAEYICEEKKGHYLFTVKNNQKCLLKMIKNEDLNNSKYDSETVEKGHGRIETRRIFVKESSLDVREKFPHAQQVFLIERISEHMSGGKIIKTTQEYCYCITSLSKEQASASELLKYNRDHWAIENKLHYVLDVTFNEDKCRCYKAEMVSALSILRKVAIHIYRANNITNIASGIRKINYS